MNWFAFYTKPRCEFKAAAYLKDIEIEHYLPVVERESQWSDRKKRVIEPVIRSYVFAKVSEKDRLLVMENQYIIRTLFFAGKPAIIPDWQIENLRSFLEKTQEVWVHNGILKGAKVKVISGPFEGVVGEIAHSPDGDTIFVTLEFMNRTIVAKLPRESVVAQTSF